MIEASFPTIFSPRGRTSDETPAGSAIPTAAERSWTAPAHAYLLSVLREVETLQAFARGWVPEIAPTPCSRRGKMVS